MYMEYPHRVISLTLSPQDGYNKPILNKVTHKVPLHRLISNQSLNLLATLSPAEHVILNWVYSPQAEFVLPDWVYIP